MIVKFDDKIEPFALKDDLNQLKIDTNKEFELLRDEHRKERGLINLQISNLDTIFAK